MCIRDSTSTPSDPPGSDSLASEMAAADDYDAMLRSRQLRSANWPRDVLTSGDLTSLRVPFCQTKEVMLLSPEA
eukprot:10668451-Alexandrium_andersonii.AAC.1